MRNTTKTISGGRSVIYNVGDKITHFDGVSSQKGIIKTVNNTQMVAWVVFHCNGDWGCFNNYSGQRVSFNNLRPGW